MIGWALVLLLLELIPTGRAAECLRPDVTGNLVLTDATLLKNDFPDGSVATIECANGYEVESGSNTLTCAGGNWSAPALICIKKDCGTPTPSPHLTYRILTDTLFGARVKSICDIGYYLQGPSYRSCLSYGWTRQAECILITCDKPKGIQNGKANWSIKEEPVMGEIIEYTCDPNYKLIGNKTIICEEMGDYNSKPPQCQPIVCEDPQIKFGVRIEEESGDLYKRNATFRCETGYRMEGSPMIFCEENGWSTFPVCIKETVQLTTESTTTTSSSITLLSSSEATETPASVFTTEVIWVIIGILIVALVVVLFVCLVHHYTKRKGMCSRTAPTS